MSATHGNPLRMRVEARDAAGRTDSNLVRMRGSGSNLLVAICYHEHHEQAQDYTSFLPQHSHR